MGEVRIRQAGQAHRRNCLLAGHRAGQIDVVDAPRRQGLGQLEHRGPSVAMHRPAGHHPAADVDRISLVLGQISDLDLADPIDVPDQEGTLVRQDGVRLEVGVRSFGEDPERAGVTLGIDVHQAERDSFTAGDGAQEDA